MVDNSATLGLTPGARVGPYEVVARIGAGGMGEVYRAIDTTLKRPVAIKVLTASAAGGAQRLARFEREAEVLASLNHPNIAAIYGVEPWEGSTALVLEFVEGDNLRACFRRSLPMDGALEIARQVLAALGAAHRAGVIHRDLKPENIMVRPDGYVKVLDFGLAKWLPSSLQAEAATTALNISEPGQVLGTVDYMSPEQIQGRDADARSDLFAFGVVLYEMLTGRHPWPRDSAVDTLHAILHDDPPLIESRPGEAGMVAVVQRLLSKRVAERYGSAEAVIDALANAAASKGSPTASRTSSGVLTSIAVVPFVFLNDIGDRRALSLGFADALITIISNLKDVVVAPISAILNYTAGIDPAQVARELRVRYTLQGTVQENEGQWRVSIQLFDAVMQKMTASETHDFTLDNVFDVQDGIGRQVVDLLHRRFPRAALSRDRYSSDPEAYNAFMAGLRESFGDQPDTVAIAAEHLSRAVERDPEFALAHATLSLVAMNIHFQFDPQRRWLQRAEDHCRLALALDHELPEGHLARAWILWSPAKSFQHLEALAALEESARLTSDARAGAQSKGHHLPPYRTPGGRARRARSGAPIESEDSHREPRVFLHLFRGLRPGGRSGRSLVPRAPHEYLRARHADNHCAAEGTAGTGGGASGKCVNTSAGRTLDRGPRGDPARAA